MKIYIVNVAARSIGQDGHKRRVLMLGLHELAEAFGERAIVICGYHALADAADIVQGIIGQKRKWPAANRLHCHEAHLGINRPGRFKKVRTAHRRIHFYLIVGATEWIAQNNLGLHVPTAVENLIGDLSAAPANLCRGEIVVSLAHGIDNPALRAPMVVWSALYPALKGMRWQQLRKTVLNTTKMWTDIDNYDCLYEGNRVEDNDWRGIFFQLRVTMPPTPGVVVNVPLAKSFT